MKPLSPYLSLISNQVQPVEPTFEKTLKDRVRELLNLEHHNFPGTQPTTFKQQHIKCLENEDYYVCEKSDGERFLMFLTIVNDAPLTFFIDRSNHYFLLKNIQLPTTKKCTFHKETLIDGELVLETDQASNTKHLRYLTFDIMVLNSHPQIQRSFSTRLGVLQNEVIGPLNSMLLSRPELKSKHEISISLKKMERSYGLVLVFKNIPNLKHDNDGLIFTPVRSGYITGINSKLFKWKPIEKYTVDFKIVVTYNSDHKPAYKLHVTDTYGTKAFSPLQLEKETWSEWRLTPPNSKIAEFRYDPTWEVLNVDQGYVPESEIGGWRFVKMREDKDQPNSEDIAKQIIESCKNPVTKEALEASITAIRLQWKQREKHPPNPPPLKTHNSMSGSASKQHHSNNPTSDDPLRTPTSQKPTKTITTPTKPQFPKVEKSDKVEKPEAPTDKVIPTSEFKKIPKEEEISKDLSNEKDKVKEKESEKEKGKEMEMEVEKEKEVEMKIEVKKETEKVANEKTPPPSIPSLPEPSPIKTEAKAENEEVVSENGVSLTEKAPQDQKDQKEAQTNEVSIDDSNDVTNSPKQMTKSPSPRKSTPELPPTGSMPSTTINNPIQKPLSSVDEWNAAKSKAYSMSSLSSRGPDFTRSKSLLGSHPDPKKQKIIGTPSQLPIINSSTPVRTIRGQSDSDIGSKLNIKKETRAYSIPGPVDHIPRDSKPLAPPEFSSVKRPINQSCTENEQPKPKLVKTPLDNSLPTSHVLSSVNLPKTFVQTPISTHAQISDVKTDPEKLPSSINDPVSPASLTHEKTNEISSEPKPTVQRIPVAPEPNSRGQPLSILNPVNQLPSNSLGNIMKADTSVNLKSPKDLPPSGIHFPSRPHEQILNANHPKASQSTELPSPKYPHPGPHSHPHPHPHLQLHPQLHSQPHPQPPSQHQSPRPNTFSTSVHQNSARIMDPGIRPSYHNNEHSKFQIPVSNGHFSNIDSRHHPSQVPISKAHSVADIHNRIPHSMEHSRPPIHSQHPLPLKPGNLQPHSFDRGHSIQSNAYYPPSIQPNVDHSREFSPARPQSHFPRTSPYPPSENYRPPMSQPSQMNHTGPSVFPTKSPSSTYLAHPSHPMNMQQHPGAQNVHPTLRSRSGSTHSSVRPSPNPNSSSGVFPPYPQGTNQPQIPLSRPPIYPARPHEQPNQSSYHPNQQPIPSSHTMRPPAQVPSQHAPQIPLSAPYQQQRRVSTIEQGPPPGYHTYQHDKLRPQNDIGYASRKQSRDFGYGRHPYVPGNPPPHPDAPSIASQPIHHPSTVSSHLPITSPRLNQYPHGDPSTTHPLAPHRSSISMDPRAGQYPSHSQAYRVDPSNPHPQHAQLHPQLHSQPHHPIYNDARSDNRPSGYDNDYGSRRSSVVNPHAPYPPRPHLPSNPNPGYPQNSHPSIPNRNPVYPTESNQPMPIRQSPNFHQSSHSQFHTSQPTSAQNIPTPPGYYQNGPSVQSNTHHIQLDSLQPYSKPPLSSAHITQSPIVNTHQQPPHPAKEKEKSSKGMLDFIMN